MCMYIGIGLCIGICICSCITTWNTQPDQSVCAEARDGSKDRLLT